MSSLKKAWQYLHARGVEDSHLLEAHRADEQGCTDVVSTRVEGKHREQCQAEHDGIISARINVSTCESKALIAENILKMTRVNHNQTWLKHDRVKRHHLSSRA